MKKDQRASFRIATSDLHALEAVAERADESLSWALSLAVRDKLTIITVTGRVDLCPCYVGPHAHQHFELRGQGCLCCDLGKTKRVDRSSAQSRADHAFNSSGQCYCDDNHHHGARRGECPCCDGKAWKGHPVKPSRGIVKSAVRRKARR